jgi:hypothetical protein
MEVCMNDTSSVFNHENRERPTQIKVGPEVHGSAGEALRDIQNRKAAGTDDVVGINHPATIVFGFAIDEEPKRVGRIDRELALGG